MVTNQTSKSQFSLVQELFASYERYRRSEIKSRRFNQAEMLGWMESTVRSGTVDVTDLGRSAEGRTISLYTYGHGPTKVLLWSQMHGDEPTATMTLLDILNFFTQQADSAITRTIQTNCSLLIVPMLNPDGAERFTRRTAQFVDLNRDAASLQTPEARILKEIQRTYKPHFGFNLHDQEARLTVGSTKNVTAIALLAPAMDPSRADNEVRLNAKRVAAVFAEATEQLAPGHTAKYDDTFEHRAFGDNIQLWGTSTVLVESGGWPNDRDKMFIRKLNFVGLIVSLHSIATQEYKSRDNDVYESLPFNSRNLYDVIVRGVELKANANTPAIRVDIGINIEEMNQEPDKRRLMAKIVDLGDLSSHGAFEEYEGREISITGSDFEMDKQIPLDQLQFLLK